MPVEARELWRRVGFWAAIATIASILIGGAVQGIFFAWEGGAAIAEIRSTLDSKAERLELQDALREIDENCEDHAESVRREVDGKVQVVRDEFHEHECLAASKLSEIDTSLKNLELGMNDLKAILREQNKP